MKSTRFKSVKFSNKNKKIKVEYTSGQKVVVHYGSLGIRKNIRSVWVDKETGNKSVGIEFLDGDVDYMPYDQPLYIVKDPEYLLQNHVENVIAQINEIISRKQVSRKYLARQLGTSDNQVQKLLNPKILNKNLTQLYKLGSLLGLEFKLDLEVA